MTTCSSPRLPLAYALALLVTASASGGCAPEEASSDGSSEAAASEALAARPQGSTFLGCKSDVIIPAVGQDFHATTRLMFRYTKKDGLVHFDFVSAVIESQIGSTGANKIHIQSSARPNDGEFINVEHLPNGWEGRAIDFTAPVGSTVTVRTSYARLRHDAVSACTFKIPR
jgi:hypothetical protein